MSTFVIEMITRRSRPTRRAPFSPVLKALFGSEARAKVLSHFVLHPGEEFHVRELSRLLDEPAGNLLRDLRRLKSIRLLDAQRVGNLLRYKMDRNHPFYHDLQRLVLRTAAADSVLGQSLRPLKGIELAFLYGSFARGEATTRSDLDVMIIGGVMDRELAPALARAERTLGREVSYTRYTRKEARERARQRDSFLQRVLSGPHLIFVGSDNDELFEIARR